MKQMVCSVCSYTYDEAKGVPEAGIAPGTPWEDLPEDWRCPWCGAGKEAFREKKETPPPPPAPREERKAPPAQGEPREKPRGGKPHIEKQLSPMELSVICSNLARGCEKQYLPEQEAAFRKLAEFFRGKADPPAEAGTKTILRLVEEDLSSGYPHANQAASGKPDRGALRALVWSEKVTRMLQLLLTRYEAEGERMLENTGVYVCSVCGFVYVGDAPPELCPVCKVPSWKFEKVGRRA
jgi:rubredoxin